VEIVPVRVVEIVPVRVVEIVPVRVVEIVPGFEKVVDDKVNINKAVPSTNVEIFISFSCYHYVRGHGRLTVPNKRVWPTLHIISI
jgi:hypothetical protein